MEQRLAFPANSVVAEFAPEVVEDVVDDVALDLFHGAEIFASSFASLNRLHLSIVWNLLVQNSQR